MIPADWMVVGASVVGSAHTARGTTCQDAHCYRVPRPGVLVVAVADGAGSAARSDEGAWVAVHRAAATLDRLCGGTVAGGPGEPSAGREADTAPAPFHGPREQPRLGQPTHADWATTMMRAFGEARAALEFLALEEAEPLRSFHCTLCCALVVDGRLLVGQIGDGACAARGADGTLFTAGAPQRGEYANEALFLTMDGALDELDVSEFEGPVDALAVCSDGLLRLAFDLRSGEPHRPFFAPLFGALQSAARPALAPAELARFLASDRVAARTDDDRTLVLAVARSPAADGAR